MGEPAGPRVLVAIPHFYRPADGVAGDGRAHGSVGRAERRVRALTACLTALHRLFGRPQCLMDFARRTTVPANRELAGGVDVVVCTTGGHHLLDRLPIDPGHFQHHPTRAEPLLLGFECHAVLRDRLGAYDHYAYLEDDLVLHDPWLFVKLAWFARHAGEDALLQPNRYEVAPPAGSPTVRKAYIDGEMAGRVTAPFQDLGEGPATLTGEVLGMPVRFRRATNPHAGCAFLSAAQMGRWAGQPHFLDRDTSFVGPLESAATLGVMRTFRLFKPAPENASFLEVEHFGTAFLDRIRSG